MSLATKSSRRSASKARPVGQFSCVFGPLMTRSGLSLPLAVIAWIEIDGPSFVPLPGTAYSRPSGQLALSRPLPEPGTPVRISRSARRSACDP